MNERIRGLSKQAFEYTLDQLNSGLEFRDFQPIWSEKFAELIVQECVDWIDGSPSTDAGQLVLTKSFIIANIKEYFGVE
jgi:hypothetical protein